MRKTLQDPDRRESIRIRKNISVQFKKGLRIAKQRWSSTTIRDISETGLCISTNVSLSPGTYIRLRLKIPTERTWLQITGRTVKSDKQENGYWIHVRLLKLDTYEKKNIRTYIAWVLVKEGGAS